MMHKLLKSVLYLLAADSERPPEGSGSGGAQMSPPEGSAIIADLGFLHEPHKHGKQCQAIRPVYPR